MIPFVLGCSGPGAAEQISRASMTGTLLLLVTWIAAALVWRVLHVRRYRLRSVVLIAAVHPGLWLSARIGDCGTMRVAASIVWTVVVFVVLAILLFRSTPGLTNGATNP